MAYSLCVKVSAEEEFIYDDQGKRNPFIPLVTQDGRLLKLDKEEGVKGLSLEGIVYDAKGSSYAMVNGDIVRPGQRVGQYVVFKIEPDKIIFLKDGEPVELELKEGEQ